MILSLTNIVGLHISLTLSSIIEEKHARAHALYRSDISVREYVLYINITDIEDAIRGRNILAEVTPPSQHRTQVPL
jgi:hypothetical protein